MSNATSMSSDVYLPISPSGEIRLLYLLPGSQDEALQCLLKNVSLSENPQYEALSYMWGPKLMKSAKVNGKICEIRENLSVALQHLRLQNQTRVLWIDAICINQNDIKERNQQVMQMGIIYSRAWKVVAWLGLHNATSSWAMLALKNTVPLNSTAEEVNTMLEAIYSFYLREYWTRLWIIQEILLAVDIVIQLGHDTISWAELRRCSLPYIPVNRGYRHSSTGLDIIDSTPLRLIRQRVYMSSRDLIRNRSLTLLELCSEHSSASCEEQCDKIFGLHSLAPKCCREAVPIDYSVSFQDICRGLLLHHSLRHELTRDVMKASEWFHKYLGITLDDFTQPPQTSQQITFGTDNQNGSSDITEFLVSVSGIIRGKFDIHQHAIEPTS